MIGLSIEWHVWRTTKWSAALLAFVAPAAAQPLPKVGTCSSGYHPSGGYCALLVPPLDPRFRNGPVPDRLPRERRLLSWPERSSPRRASGRRMPVGYHVSGAYCLKNR